MSDQFDFENTPVGHVESFEHTITDADVESFAKLTGDLNPLHLDKDYAQSVGFGKPVVYGMLSASFISTMIGMRIPGKGALWTRQTLEFLLPTYVGDRLCIEAKIIQKSIATRILVLEIKITNQNSQVILKGESQLKVLRTMTENDSKKKSDKKVFLVTGASRGIGAATARQLALDGCIVGVNYLQNEVEASKVVSQINELGGQGMLLRADVSKPQEVTQMVSQLAERFGQIDGFVHCAAPQPIAVSLDGAKWDDFQNQIDTQLKGAFLLAKEITPHLLNAGGGSIVLMSSIYADGTPPTQLSSYVVAKSALSAFARCLAVELGPKGIRVNIVSPGITMTDMTSQVPEKAKLLAKMNTPLRKLAMPEDIAATVSFLMGPASGHVSGENIRVCGGVEMY